jgi:protein-S-isoprenylcysteine O-methyltransferase Ste14
LAFVVFVPGIVGVFIPIFLLAKEPISLQGLRALGLLPLLAGACVTLWCIWDFGKTGRGTPAPFDPPTVLVVKGFYRYVRNPMYVGVLLVVMSEAILFSSWPILIYALCSAAGFHFFVTLYEEPTLRRTFGSAYDDYAGRVPRWMPRIARTEARKESKWS